MTIILYSFQDLFLNVGMGLNSIAFTLLSVEGEDLAGGIVLLLFFLLRFFGHDIFIKGYLILILELYIYFPD